MSLLIRVTFTLGNITSLSDESRVALATELKCVPRLINIFSTYGAKYLEKTVRSLVLLLQPGI